VGALREAGFGNKTLTMAHNLNQRFPKDELLNQYWLSAIRGAVELMEFSELVSTESRMLSGFFIKKNPPCTPR
jgi:hypothetical protein